jgi:biopolymer transport protein ExbB/TolQ
VHGGCGEPAFSSIVPTAVGLAVAVLAGGGYSLLRAQVREFDIEMLHAAEQLGVRLRR